MDKSSESDANIAVAEKNRNAPGDFKGLILGKGIGRKATV